MNQHSRTVMITLALVALGWSCIRFTDAASMGLVPLPQVSNQAPNPMPQQATYAKEDGEVHLLQENVNVVMDGNHEVDLSVAPKRINMPFPIEVVPKNNDVIDPRREVAPQPVARDAQVIVSSGPEAFMRSQNGTVVGPMVPSVSYSISYSNASNVAVRPLTTGRPISIAVVSTQKPAGSGATRLEVGLLLATVSIISTLLNMHKYIR